MLAFLKNITSTDTDEGLVAAYRKHADLKILGQLYERYMDLVYGVSFKYLKEPEDAKDAVLNIFEELISKLQKHEVTHFKSWLYQLTKNHCLMRLRSDKKMRVVRLDASFMQSEETLHLNGALEKEETLGHMEYCLGELPEEQRPLPFLTGFGYTLKNLNKVSGMKRSTSGTVFFLFGNT